MSRVEYLTERLRGLFMDFNGSCEKLSYKEQEDLWNKIFKDPYEEIMQELEKL